MKIFYKKNFWDTLRCSEMPEIIAEEIFEQAINLGKHIAGIHLQQTLNILNKNQKLYSDIEIDGIIGEAPVVLVFFLQYHKFQ